MELLDFGIKLYDFTEKWYVTKARPGKGGGDQERLIITFTFSWEGRVADMDEHDPKAYLGAEHRGCVFYITGDGFGWDLPKSLYKGSQLRPNKQNLGLEKLVMAKLETTKYAARLLEEREKARMTLIPDAEKPESEMLNIT